MSIRNAYNQWADSYDSDANPTRDLDAHVVRSTLAALRPRRALEIGCGTGKNSEFLAGIARTVIGLDFSAGMLAKAARRAPHGHVLFTVADLRRDWPCRSASCDLVVCSLVLEHIEDLAFPFAQAARMLAPGGRFFVCELHPFKQYQGTAANFTRGGERVRVAAFTHHISDYLQAARNSRFKLLALNEWWSEADAGGIPRVVSFLFEAKEP